MTIYVPAFAEHVDAIPALLEAIVRQAATDYCAGYSGTGQRDRYFHSARRFLTRAELVPMVEQALAAGRVVHATPARRRRKTEGAKQWN